MFLITSVLCTTVYLGRDKRNISKVLRVLKRTMKAKTKINWIPHSEIPLGRGSLLYVGLHLRETSLTKCLNIIEDSKGKKEYVTDLIQQHITFTVFHF